MTEPYLYTITATPTLITPPTGVKKLLLQVLTAGTLFFGESDRTHCNYLACTNNSNIQLPAETYYLSVVSGSVVVGIFWHGNT